MKKYAKLCKIISQHTKMYKNIPKYIEIQENMQNIRSVVLAIIFNWWNKSLLIIDYIWLIRFIKIRTYIKRSVTQFRWKRKIWPLFYALFQRNVKLGGGQRLLKAARIDIDSKKWLHLLFRFSEDRRSSSFPMFAVALINTCRQFYNNVQLFYALYHYTTT